ATRLVVQGDAAVSDERRTYWTFEGQPSWKASSGSALLSGLKGEFRLAGPGLPDNGVVLPLEAQFSYAVPEQRLAGEGRVRQGEQAVAWSLRGQQLGLDPQWTIELKSDVFNLEQ